MMRKTALALGVAASAIAAPAMARDGEGYIGVDAGAVVYEDSQILISGGRSATVEYDTSWELGAVVGYDWGPIRTELEGSYKEADTDTITSVSVNGPATPATLP